MKVGIVVPFSWPFWGAVNEHAELQAEALRGLGIETRTIVGNDPPGSFTRLLHPRLGRLDTPPPDLIPVGRTVIAPANGSLLNIVLSPPALRKWHAAGPLRLNRAAVQFCGFLMERVDYKIAVSEQAHNSHADAGGREHHGMVLARARLVVASDLPGYRSVMTPETGVLVPPADPAALTDAVAALLEDEPRRRALGAAGRRLAVERYSWNRIAARLAEVYEHVAGARVPVAAPTRLEPVPA